MTVIFHSLLVKGRLLNLSSQVKCTLLFYSFSSLFTCAFPVLPLLLRLEMVVVEGKAKSLYFGWNYTAFCTLLMIWCTVFSWILSGDLLEIACIFMTSRSIPICGHENYIWWMYPFFRLNSAATTENYGGFGLLVYHSCDEWSCSTKMFIIFKLIVLCKVQ